MQQLYNAMYNKYWRLGGLTLEFVIWVSNSICNISLNCIIVVGLLYFVTLGGY
jgi:hypothetical protein